MQCTKGRTIFLLLKGEEGGILSHSRTCLALDVSGYVEDEHVREDNFLRIVYPASCIFCVLQDPPGVKRRKKITC